MWPVFLDGTAATANEKDSNTRARGKLASSTFCIPKAEM